MAPQHYACLINSLNCGKRRAWFASCEDIDSLLFLPYYITPTELQVTATICIYLIQTPLDFPRLRGLDHVAGRYKGFSCKERLLLHTNEFHMASF